MYKPNERFTVVLEDNPGSGTSWIWQPSDVARLVSQRTEDTRAPGDTRLGANQRRIFEFEALRSGTLNFNLVGPGRDAEVYQKFSQSVSVEGSDAGSWQALFFVSVVGLGVWAFLHFGKKAAPARQPALNQNYGYR